MLKQTKNLTKISRDFRRLSKKVFGKNWPRVRFDHVTYQLYNRGEGFFVLSKNPGVQTFSVRRQSAQTACLLCKQLTSH